MKRLIAIVGPTGIGKSQLALQIAPAFKGEIVSADSRQLYCHMDIGTAKPTPAELSIVPHHLINIADPDQDFSLARYQELAYGAIADIHRRQKLPVLVGGSGMYVWSVLEGWRIPRVPPDSEFRRELEEKAARVGSDALYRELEAVDPAAGQRALDQEKGQTTEDGGPGDHQEAEGEHQTVFPEREEDSAEGVGPPENPRKPKNTQEAQGSQSSELWRQGEDGRQVDQHQWAEGIPQAFGCAVEKPVAPGSVEEFQPARSVRYETKKVLG